MIGCLSLGRGKGVGRRTRARRRALRGSPRSCGDLACDLIHRAGPAACPHVSGAAGRMSGAHGGLPGERRLPVPLDDLEGRGSPSMQHAGTTTLDMSCKRFLLTRCKCFVHGLRLLKAFSSQVGSACARLCSYVLARMVQRTEKCSKEKYV